ncbi:MAG TPA: tRNA (adenosine(37)-N6)-dimethylallyltransferase MiaA [Oscillospiraceae bacterium]|nr:tRNA (adenosine(37)-N6)-dimethylallyltransferase MiaA [Oscillospiraceae bacterium]
MPRKILVITGPTATGKTRLGVELALLFGGEVVSADSMQVYRRMDIGTAKPGSAEMRGVPHHMIDVAEPWETYSVGRYVPEAARCVDAVLARGKLPIVVGGTGLYIDSLLSGRSFAPRGGTRVALEQEADEKGTAAMLAQLRAVDPDRAQLLHENDRKRILRALEIYRGTGETITRHDAESRLAPPRYEALKIALDFRARDDLRARISRRVDEMVAAGLPGEVASLLDEGVPPGSTAMQAIGYKEMVSAVRGARSVSDAAEEVKLRSRQYAKRQLTWLRRDETVRWLRWETAPDFGQAVRFSTDCMSSFGLR